MTAHCVTSLPVPAVVGMVVKGGIRFVKGFFLQLLHNLRREHYELLLHQ